MIENEFDSIFIESEFACISRRLATAKSGATSSKCENYLDRTWGYPLKAIKRTTHAHHYPR